MSVPNPLPKIEIKAALAAVKDTDWQQFRRSLKGLPTKSKITKLSGWLRKKGNSRRAQLQVVNYMNALLRGGQLKKGNDGKWRVNR